MKRITWMILVFLFMLCGASQAGPIYYAGGGGGVHLDSNCDQAQYYALGTLCQDTDDGKLYKGTGAAVVEMAAGSAFAVTDISGATELAAAPAESDEFPINDGGVLKKITVLNLLNALENSLTGFAIHADNLPDLSSTYEPAGSNNIDPDRLNGDGVDDDKVDNAILAPPVVQNATCTDSGDGNPGALTLTPTAGLNRVDISLTVSDAHGCAITMGEAGAVAETLVVITNVSAANTATFITSADVLTLKRGSPYVMGAKESLVLLYKPSEWLEVGRTGAEQLTILDDAAQIANSTDTSKKLKLDASNQGAGQTGTIQAPVNGTATLTAGTGSITVASGDIALATGEIASGACTAAQTDSATGTATTDVILWGFNADPTSTTGYSPSANGMLTIIAYPTANNVNFKVCNNTAAAVTPGATTLNWRVLR